MVGESNVDKLVNARVLPNAGSITREQSEIINDQMTDAEIEALISIKGKLGGPPWELQGDGGGF